MCIIWRWNLIINYRIFLKLLSMFSKNPQFIFCNRCRLLFLVICNYNKQKIYILSNGNICFVEKQKVTMKIRIFWYHFQVEHTERKKLRIWKRSYKNETNFVIFYSSQETNNGKWQQQQKMYKITEKMHLYWFYSL